MSLERSASPFSTSRESSSLPEASSYVSPVKLLASIDSHPGFIHEHLRISLLAVCPQRVPRRQLPT